MSDNIKDVEIKVIGVGGGGGNMVNHMIKEGISGIDMIVANTDAQALESSLAKQKIQLGAKKTRGLGAGMKPEVGAKAAEESFDEIKDLLDGANMVFIATGLGGGTGTGAAPVVARAAREVGALTISVVTRPFFFEGKKRDKLALAGIDELKVESDSMVVIQNDKLLSIIEKSLGTSESFKMVDSVLTRAVSGMSSVVLSCSESDINTDFADVKTIMEHRGLAILSVGESVGDDAAVEAITNAIESPLLDNLSIKGALGVLIHFQINPNFPLLQIQSAMDIIHDSADEDADIIFGTTTNEKLADNEVKITIVATGFGSSNHDISTKKISSVNNSDKTPEFEIKPDTTIAEQTTPPTIAGINNKFAENGGYIIENVRDIDLDIPTFLRNKMD
jgi:cell division protein FtsZ